MSIISSQSFIDNIKEWVTLDNNYQNLMQEIKEIRLLKQKYQHELYNYLGDKNLQNAQITIGDGKLRFNNTQVSQPLTFKYIESTLREIINDENHIELIINTLKQRRNVKTIAEIKRYYNK